MGKRKGQRRTFGQSRSGIITWLPEWIVKRDPNVIVARVSKTGYIYRVWVHDNFMGPLAPDLIAGCHVRDLVDPVDSEKLLSLINTLNDVPAIRDQVTLKINVLHKTRSVRILPLDKNNILAFLIKPSVEEALK